MPKTAIQKTIAFSGLALFIFPIVFILWQEISSPLGQSNPFMIVFILMYGGIPALTGLLIFILVYPRSRTKFIAPFVSITPYLLLLPAIWGINSVKENLFLNRHADSLEKIATALLQDKMETTEGNKILQQKNIPVTVDCIPQEKEHILFLFGGMIDNCYGIAWSETGKQPSENCCGIFISWKKKKGNWYIWSTT